MTASTLLKSLCPVVAIGLAGAATGAALEWDAGGDGVSTFQEANWNVIDNSGQPGWTVALDPPAGAVDGGTAISAHLIVGGAATAGGGGAGAEVILDDGFSLTVRDGATFRMRIATDPEGMRGTGGGLTETLIIEDNALVVSQFLVTLAVSMSDASELVLNGGGNPINDTTIFLASDWTGSITFNDEDVAAVTAEHLSKITVNGAAATLGVNVNLVSDGDVGSVLTVIPEPGSMALLGLGGLLVARRRHG